MVPKPGSSFLWSRGGHPASAPYLVSFPFGWELQGTLAWSTGEGGKAGRLSLGVLPPFIPGPFGQHRRGSHPQSGPAQQSSRGPGSSRRSVWQGPDSLGKLLDYHLSDGQLRLRAEAIVSRCRGM